MASTPPETSNDGCPIAAGVPTASQRAANSVSRLATQVQVDAATKKKKAGGMPFKLEERGRHHIREFTIDADQQWQTSPGHGRPAFEGNTCM